MNLGKLFTHRAKPLESTLYLPSEEECERLREKIKLSPREMQVARGILDDSTEFAIAQDLGISPHTVHTHIKRVYNKLGVKTRVQLTIHILMTHFEMILESRMEA